MEINEFELSAADGILLLNDIRIEDRFFPQGHKLNREDISFLKSYGIKKITGVRACNSDIKSALALGMIAPQICGENLGYVVSKTTNTCKIVASVDGVFICEFAGGAADVEYSASGASLAFAAHGTHSAEHPYPHDKQQDRCV